MARYNSIFQGPTVDEGIADGIHALKNFAQDYVPGQEYALNDLVIYQGDLYRCKAVPTGISWNSSKWEQVLITNLAPSYIPYQIEGGGGGETVEGGYTLRLLNANDKNMFIFSTISGGRIQDVYPYPTKSGQSFKGWCSVKGDSSTRVSFPITVTEDMVLYPFFSAGVSTLIENLGSSSPASVRFTKVSNFPTESECYEEVTLNGNKFAKFYPWYKKPFYSEGVLTGYEISNIKEDNNFYPYECFLDEEGNLLPYILIGQYCMSSTSTASSVDASRAIMTIGTARALASALGPGYQIMDAAMKMFWQDLACACFGAIDFNAGSGVASYMGLKRMTEGGWWIDGIAQNSGAIYFSNKPSKYIDSPTASTDGYDVLSYTCPTTGSSNVISALGYDANHPTISYPCAQGGTNNYSTYYCDGYWYSGGNHPVDVYVGVAIAISGLFHFGGSDAWSYAFGARLCYKPVV